MHVFEMSKNQAPSPVTFMRDFGPTRDCITDELVELGPFTLMKQEYPPAPNFGNMRIS